MLSLRPPGLEFRILCLEDSVISPSSGGSPDPIYPICAQRWPKDRFISFMVPLCMGNVVFLNTARQLLMDCDHFKLMTLQITIKRNNHLITVYIMFISLNIKKIVLFTRATITVSLNKKIMIYL